MSSDFYKFVREMDTSRVHPPSDPVYTDDEDGGDGSFYWDYDFDSDFDYYEEDEDDDIVDELDFEN